MIGLRLHAVLIVCETAPVERRRALRRQTLTSPVDLTVVDSRTEQLRLGALRTPGVSALSPSSAP
ncbi:hypothetical protein ZHAS_00021247 [Anopheles sinensis]|uniref:Uncharacterized protein n=1 Tax=Anopheles sinensis TaxID=74873 RepID=A0A084WS57_ANOSI|nr:hypothetical protein ZHAS_00021247 [Anopheles sinensis]